MNNQNSTLNSLIHGKYKINRPSESHSKFCQENFEGRTIYSIDQIYTNPQKQCILLILLCLIIAMPLTKSHAILDLARLGPKP